MKVMVVGGGGREHALVWKLSTSPRVKKIFCAPGNAGTAKLAENVPIKAEDIEALAAFAQGERIDLTVVGPEAPLVAGIVDVFRQRGLAVFGPTAAAAALEGSKVFAKELMDRYGIPTAKFAVFEDYKRAQAYIQQVGVPIVVKAEGLAAGKGVVVARDEETALEAVYEIMEGQIYGAAGRRVVIEECLEGEEVTLLAFTDGENILPLVASQDHKQVYDEDRGPNTGGMGCYSPVPAFTPALQEEVYNTILIPTVRSMQDLGRPFTGVLYAGLMLTGDGPRVLEFNARFGDPETQVILPRLENDLVDVLEACLLGGLSGLSLRWREEAAVCVIMASGGYPGPYQKGFPIRGLEMVETEEDVLVFHAGTESQGGEVVTAGGRVLGVTGLGKGIAEARTRVYQAVEKISFSGAHFRRDIGVKALR
ncbi:MAG TPA: phosphoribosylamine--glycine ligase [Firmicutes bacterium]|nr:phosphoribosylamine--glycine ligase [Bacillota bacterium]